MDSTQSSWTLRIGYDKRICKIILENTYEMGLETVILIGSEEWVFKCTSEDMMKDLTCFAHNSWMLIIGSYKEICKIFLENTDVVGLDIVLLISSEEGMFENY